MSFFYPFMSDLCSIKKAFYTIFAIVQNENEANTIFTMRVYLLVLTCILFMPLFAQKTHEVPTVYIDNHGIIRWADSDKEAVFYGVNYTLPFAHAYRAVDYSGKSHKEAIDKDVYHMARLGFNAYRIHIWDVEISDEKGQLQQNTHLDLLDYLISKLRERDIRILITAMTNFGNGYPERNQNTGGFSYLYDKCDVHNNNNAIKAQENYISSLITHINPYTGQAYKNDPYIIGFEINNEPCHSGTPDQTKSYINKMLTAIKKTGNDKPIFYNVSHNLSHVDAYYDTAIQGTTYQWYPIGLVAGHTRKGNFLPHVDNFRIPFSNIKNFEKKTKAVYEFDPADITYSYMYPAMARTFRSQGFQWITQFAYDPIDIAYANTEYQTHYLNLAYTPGKAISMKIAAEAAYSVPMNKIYPAYPNDTVFDGFRVSYIQDLSELNTPEKFFYSNNTSTQPIEPDKIMSIAGCGSSPVISYDGTGAYFLDKLEAGVWRLEVMPDAVQLKDPFEKASLNKEVVTIRWNNRNMNIRLSDLGPNFDVLPVNEGNNNNVVSSETLISVMPGVYLLKRKNKPDFGNRKKNSRWNNIILNEFVAPEDRVKTFSVVHTPPKVAERGKPLFVKATVIGPALPDSVIIYTDKISFWAKNNPYVKMKRKSAYTYEAEIPQDETDKNTLRYNIIVCYDNQYFTFPSGIKGNPLDWDYYKNDYWSCKIVDSSDPIVIINNTDNYLDIEYYAIPAESWVESIFPANNVFEPSIIDFRFKAEAEDSRFFIRKDIKDDITPRKESLKKVQNLCLYLKDTESVKQIKAGFITSFGYTYTTILNPEKDNPILKIPLQKLVIDSTALLPLPYPVFSDKYFTPQSDIPFSIEDIETFEISAVNIPETEAGIKLGPVWLE